MEQLRPPIAEKLPLPKFKLKGGFAQLAQTVQKQLNVATQVDVVIEAKVPETTAVKTESTVEAITQQEAIPSAVDELVSEITSQSKSQEKKLKSNATTMLDAIQLSGNLLAGAMNFFKLAAAACPHCAFVAMEGVSQGFQGGMNLAGLGHYHSDGTFHEDSHEHESGSNAFFLDWLKESAA